ncbi:MAG: MlaD family protein [Simkaniaceae bacterium]|nr:MlaD family protein [Simkaniaceae bacterium]
MIEYIKNALIGFFVAVACALIVGFILFLEPSAGDGKQALVVRFSNINSISVGTRVMFAGKPVGEVTGIERIPDARQEPTDALGRLYFYQLILHIDSGVRVYDTDEFTVQTSGLLGEKSVAIIPKAASGGTTPTRITAKTPVYAQSVDHLESTLHELSNLSDKAEEALDRVVTWIDRNGSGLAASIHAFGETMEATTHILKTIDDIRLVDLLAEATDRFATTWDRIGHIVADMEKSRLFTDLRCSMAHFRSASRAADIALNRFTQGEGTLGRLLVDDETYLRITALLSKCDTLMNDVNHYGIFFNLNKKWQRARTKEINRLNALKSPAAFREYFIKEVDSINMAMSRLSLLVDRAERNSERKEIFHSTPFQADFAELLRNVHTLYENLRLYNEELQSVYNQRESMSRAE